MNTKTSSEERMQYIDIDAFVHKHLHFKINEKMYKVGKVKVQTLMEWEEMAEEFKKITTDSQKKGKLGDYIKELHHHMAERVFLVLKEFNEGVNLDDLKNLPTEALRALVTNFSKIIDASFLGGGLGCHEIDSQVETQMAQIIPEQKKKKTTSG